MMTIDIDFEVFKKLTSERENESVSYNDVLRRLLKLNKLEAAPSGRSSVNTDAPTDAKAWFCKGVVFPAGTEFRASHRGQPYYGRVESGGLVVTGKNNGKPFHSPSAAAVAIAEYPVNGWVFWECRLPGSASWQMIKSLRRGAETRSR